MEIFFDRLSSLKGKQSTSAFARSIGIPQPSMDRYLKGRMPTIEVLRLLCSAYEVSANWMLGLPERSSTPSVGANAVVANGLNAVAVGHDTVVGGDCSKCLLMQEHIRQITGRS